VPRCRAVHTLITPAELKSLAPSLRVVDLGSPDAYGRAHIPGALRVPLNGPATLKSAVDPLHVVNGAEFTALARELAISRNTDVVLYDASTTITAARAWWVFQYYGHPRCRVLDGGWARWVGEGHSVEVAAQPVPQLDGEPTTAKPQPHLLARREELMRAVSRPARHDKCQVLDTRTLGEFAGADLRGNARGGRVPGACHVPHADLLTPQGALRPAAELRQLFEQAGLNPDVRVVTYCQTGIRAALGALALRVAGFGDVANYDASMKEWLNDPQAPVER
jgi:thiosulfate/3-mercaptopyruvate sulfurtransferase